MNIIVVVVVIIVMQQHFSMSHRPTWDTGLWLAVDIRVCVWCELQSVVLTDCNSHRCPLGGRLESGLDANCHPSEASEVPFMVLINQVKKSDWSRREWRTSRGQRGAQQWQLTRCFWWPLLLLRGKILRLLPVLLSSNSRKSPRQTGKVQIYHGAQCVSSTFTSGGAWQYQLVPSGRTRFKHIFRNDVWVQVRFVQLSSPDRC